MTRSTDPSALVVGACAHGLAIARALGRRGRRVHVLEADTTLPGTSSRYASVDFVPDVNGAGLITALGNWHARHTEQRDAVLFLTNDNMVHQVATHWQSLAGKYQLSWSHCADTVNHFLSKSALESRCLKVGLAYPASVTLHSATELHALTPQLTFPAIVKPVRPLSRFKVELVQSLAELQSLVTEFSADLPFLVQQWIPGDDTSLRFCALYLDRGKVMARFDGQKLRSRRPALGGTTAAIPYRDDDLYDQTLNFFRGLDLSGPVSLEMKRDPAGKYWVIEPTLGRTDYWVACCTANGVDLPNIEFCHQAKLAVPESAQKRVAVWCDTEYDHWARMALAFQPLPQDRRFQTTAYPYLAADDWAPFFMSLRRSAVDFLQRVRLRIRRHLRSDAKQRRA